MSTTAEALLEQALALAPEDRASLASDLLASLDDHDADPDEVERLWSAETERRMAMFESGEAEVVDWDHLIERIDAPTRALTGRLTLGVRLHPRADDDLVAVWTWYESQRGGLGEDFPEAVRIAVGTLAQWPDSGAPMSKDANSSVTERKAATSGFPYVIRYRIIDEYVVVMAVHHERRHPDFGSDRSV